MNPVFLKNYTEFAEKAKYFASRYNPCVILDSCQIEPPLKKSAYKLLIGFGGNKISEPQSCKIETVYNTWLTEKIWMFGVLGYNLKNEIEKLGSTNDTCFHWPDTTFFIPETVLTISWDNYLTIYDKDFHSILEAINNARIEDKLVNTLEVHSKLKIDFDKRKHNQAVDAIKTEIRNGNVYELNLCSRFLYETISVSHPHHLYEELIKISPAPFSAYFSIGNKFVLSASPERYLAKFCELLISQPIKGTRPRNEDTTEDDALKKDLYSNVKDRAENVMIVDLVRNDMARVAKAGTVKVDELFGIYSYSHVHQMVSTISSELDSSHDLAEILRATFPMGSMTGAPKIAAIQWIDRFEISNREWYSGALGYIDPEGNMDFNVLIRSVFYDSSLQRLAYYAGGAITIDSEPEEEFHEMMVKAKAINTLLMKYFKQ